MTVLAQEPDDARTQLPRAPHDEDHGDHVLSRCPTRSPASMRGGTVSDNVRTSDLVGPGLRRPPHPDIALTVRRLRRTSS